MVVMQKGMQLMSPDDANGRDLGYRALVGDERLPLFVFGEQLDAAFLAQLLQHRVSGEPAQLIGYRSEQLGALAWPVLVAAADESVAGRVFRNLDAEDYQRIDAYQGVSEQLYHRVRVAATVCDDRPLEPVFAFLPTPATFRRYG